MKLNRCVGCGAEQDYMKHYIVPYSYRTLFPDRFKTHLPHDIVLLCAKRCHWRAQQQVHHRMTALEEQLRRQRHHHTHDATTALSASSSSSAHAELVDFDMQRVRSAATALLQWKAHLPEHQIQKYNHRVCAWVAPDNATDSNNSSESSEPTQEQLEAASRLECRSPNPHYIPGAVLVVDSLKVRAANNKDEDDDLLFDEVALSEFVRDWRRHFIDVVRPQCLPTGWSVDAPVQSDHC